MTTFTIAGEGEPYDEAQAAVAHTALAAASRRLARAVKMTTGREYKTANEAVERAILALYKSQPNVFALTGTRTRGAIDMMCHFGMLDLDARPMPEPDPDQFGVTDAMIAGLYAAGDVGDEWDEPREMALYRGAMDAFWDRQPMPNPSGIPAYKVQSAGWWLITPDEITAALGAYRTALGEDTAPPMFWWAPWLEFLERASKHLGARVGAR